MRANRYPITEIGILNLTKRLIEVAEAGQEIRRMRGQVLQRRQDRQPPLHLHRMVTHPTPRKNFRFNIAKVFVDDEYGIPVRYEAYRVAEPSRAARRFCWRSTPTST